MSLIATLNTQIATAEHEFRTATEQLVQAAKRVRDNAARTLTLLDAVDENVERFRLAVSDGLGMLAGDYEQALAVYLERREHLRRLYELREQTRSDEAAAL